MMPVAINFEKNDIINTKEYFCKTCQKNTKLIIVKWEKKTYSILGYNNQLAYIGITQCCNNEYALKNDLKDVKDIDVPDLIIGNYYPSDFRLNIFAWLLVCWTPCLSIILTLILYLYKGYINKILHLGYLLMIFWTIIINYLWYYYLFTF